MEDKGEKAMERARGAGRRFLMLQGPHGPFFDRLARGLRGTGAEVWRAGFNRGDAAFWSDPASYIAVTDPPEAWPATLAGLLDRLAITDLAVYGDTRPCHAAAIAAARARGLAVHVFEEGYLRPAWITCERDGANGNSPLMRLSLGDMAAGMPEGAPLPGPLSDRWGNLRAHIGYGALYHGLVLLPSRRYCSFRPHRGLPVGREFALHLRRLAALPLLAPRRMLTTRKIRRGGFRYYVVLLQLAHDANFLHHGPFATMTGFLEQVIAAFAEGAPRGHHLVFKAHPLEDARIPLGPEIARIAGAAGLADRVHLVDGGRLARLLAGATGAVTVNSTAGPYAIWRGLPLCALGAAVYGKPGLVSDRPLAAFFAAPDPPDRAAFELFRRYLLATSQIPGDYYTREGREHAIGPTVERLLSAPVPALAQSSTPSSTPASTPQAGQAAAADPSAAAPPGEAERQHLRAIAGQGRSPVWSFGREFFSVAAKAGVKRRGR
ncbi:hypothetical protein BYZ73_07925 [Rhodovulum viride]|uniref:Capsular polysaccharide export protein n=1 Tax=Rhodovulum viride TaxID=1231134 RepID=A0ABX9DKH0_9RHOB|nr:capsule biosynthesis protein CapA [Rhodovulum viride]RAP41871.1 hypothetical protein BYZ73_07925 [Rhodovulum viride]